MATSAGGSAKISHPWPASTDENPRVCRKKARSAVASLLYTTTWAPKIMNAPLVRLSSTEVAGRSRERQSWRLDGHLAAHARIGSAIDLAHAAGRKRRQDFVGSEASSGRERHIDLSYFTLPNCSIGGFRLEKRRLLIKAVAL